MTGGAPMDDSECTAPAAARTAKPSVALSTRALESMESRTAWAGVLDATYCEMDIDWAQEREPFRADIVARQVGDLSVSVVRADPHAVVRSPATISSDPSDDYLLCLITRGTATISQGDGSITVDNGSFGIVDTARPFTVAGITEFHQVVVRTPRAYLDGRLPAGMADAVPGRLISADGGSAGITSRLLVDIAGRDDSYSAGSSMAIAAALVDLVVAAVTDQVTPVSATERAHAADLIVVQRAMLDRMADPDYAIADVAARLGMSVRYVHKLFESTGTTPRAWLYQRRLDRAVTMLLQTPRSVAEIAVHLGFRDASHFSRVFRRRFTASPAQFRAANTGTD